MLKNFIKEVRFIEIGATLEAQQGVANRVQDHVWKKRFYILSFLFSFIFFSSSLRDYILKCGSFLQNIASL